MSNFARFSVCFFVAILPISIAVADPSKPGAAQRKSIGWEHVTFAGNRAFSDAQLRNALLAEPDFLFAAHPHGPAADLGTHAEKLLVKGYQNSGFPHASISAKRSGDELVCSIDEGPRFRNGPIKIRGTTRLSVDALRERLTQPYPSDDAFPTYVAVNGAVITRWVDEDGDEQDLEDAAWEPLKPVRFGNEKRIQDLVSEALSDLGFSNAIAITKVIPDEATRVASLVIDVIDEGKPDRIESVAIGPLKQNTAKQVLEFVGASEGDEINAQRIQDITKRLWDCGRFSKHQVRFNAATAELQMDLEEIAGLPPLDAPVSEEGKAFLAAHRWISQLDARNEEFEFLHQSDGVRIRTVMSQLGMFAEATFPSVDQHDSPRTLTLLADEHGLLISHSEHPAKLWIDTTDIDGRLTFGQSFGATLEDEHVYSAKLKIQVSSKRKAHQVPLAHSLKVSPADFLPLAYKEKLSRRFVGEELVCRYRDEQIVINRNSGRITRCGYGGNQVRFGKGLFEKAKEDFLTRVAAKPNEYDDQRAATSVAAYLLSPSVVESVQAIIRASGEDVKPIPQEFVRALRKLVNGGLLCAPDCWIAGIASEEQESFIIPSSGPYPDSWELAMMQFGAKAILKVAPDCFRSGGWPMQVIRESCLMMIGKGKYTEQVLNDIVQDPDNGPLCHAVVAHLLAAANHPGADTFASLSLDALNEDDFARDYRAISTIPGSRLIVKTLLAFQSLTEAELDALLAVGGTDAVDRFIRKVHSSRVVGPQDAGAFWYRLCEESLRSSMEKLR